MQRGKNLNKICILQSVLRWVQDLLFIHIGSSWVDLGLYLLSALLLWSREEFYSISVIKGWSLCGPTWRAGPCLIFVTAVMTDGCVNLCTFTYYIHNSSWKFHQLAAGQLLSGQPERYGKAGGTACPSQYKSHLPGHRSAVKGTVPRDFCFWFFSWISFPPAPEYSIKTVSNFFENSRRYSQLKVCHRCQRHRWQMEKIFNQKNCKNFIWSPLGSRGNIYINFCLQVHFHVSAAWYCYNYLPPVAICHRRRWHRRQICKNSKRS